MVSSWRQILRLARVAHAHLTRLDLDCVVEGHGLVDVIVFKFWWLILYVLLLCFLHLGVHAMSVSTFFAISYTKHPVHACSNVFDFTNKFPMNLMTNSFCHTNCPPKSRICVFFSRNPGTHAGKTGNDHENFREALRLTSQNTHPDFFARMLPLLQSDLQYKPSSRHVDIVPIIFLLHNIRTATPASTGPFTTLLVSHMNP